MDLSEVEKLAPAKLDDASRLLLAAATVLETSGWIQGKFYDRGAHCALGALTRAAINLNIGSDYFLTAEDRLAASVCEHIPTWNDNPFRTQAEVVAKLRAVALSGSDA